MTRFVLLEWVGRWSLAGCGSDRAPLFRTEIEAWEWVRAKFGWESDPPDEIERTLTRFRVARVELPAELIPEYEGAVFTGRYIDRQ